MQNEYFFKTTLLPHSYGNTDNILWVYVDLELEHPSISDNSRNCSKGQWKYRVKRALRIYYDIIVTQEASAKSKCKGLVQAKTKIKREEYIDELPKKMARLIFMSRCNMLPIKAHMPCRLCGEDDETLDHLVQACPGSPQLPTEDVPKLTTMDRFSTDIPTLRRYGQLLSGVMEALGPH